jgi:hypothetical protein
MECTLTVTGPISELSALLALVNGGGSLTATAQPVTRKAEKAAPPAEKAIVETAAAPAETTSAPEAEASEDITIEQIREAVSAKAKTHREGIKAALKDCHVDNISGLKPHQYLYFMKLIKALA